MQHNHLNIAVNVCGYSAQSKLSTGTGAEIDWWSLWSVDQRMGILCVHFAWGLYVLLFNSMVLNVLAYGQEHLHMNTVVIGKNTDNVERRI